MLAEGGDGSRSRRITNPTGLAEEDQASPPATIEFPEAPARLREFSVAGGGWDFSRCRWQEAIRGKGEVVSGIPSRH